jgi:hypothetical protein
MGFYSGGGSKSITGEVGEPQPVKGYRRMKKRTKRRDKELEMNKKGGSRKDSPVSVDEKPDLTNFFRLAKKECTNFSEIGPFKIKHYCYQEPIQTNHQCRLAHGIPCVHFAEAVLPWDQDLKHEWLLMQSGTSTASAIQSGSTLCECGKRFKTRSNRQKFCPACSKANRRKLNREAARRHASRRAPPNTLDACS